jgi:hypothetical protein
MLTTGFYKRNNSDLFAIPGAHITEETGKIKVSALIDKFLLYLVKLSK